MPNIITRWSKGFLPLTYAWPGNVRELENLIERAVVMSPQETITAEFLALSPQGTAQPGSLQPLTEAKEAFERGYLKDLLGATQGNISRASQIAEYLTGVPDCRPVSSRFLQITKKIRSSPFR
jgi:transcriptional regulator with PAS, ATPase and Fis domain